MAYNQSMLAGAGGLAGMGLGQMFGGWENPANAGMSYMNGIPDELKKYYNPYLEAGQRALPGLENQYGMLMNDPGSRLNQIGQGYQQSPGFKFALQQALNGSNQASAAGGMGGSPQNMQQNMGLATNLASQDYNQWLQHALGLYGMGIQGQQGMYNTGFNAASSLGDNLASVMGSQAQLAYEGQNAENQHQGGSLGSLLGGLSSLGSLLAFG